jgi:hypothetical protein
VIRLAAVAAGRNGLVAVRVGLLGADLWEVVDLRVRVNRCRLPDRLVDAADYAVAAPRSRDKRLGRDDAPPLAVGRLDTALGRPAELLEQVERLWPQRDSQALAVRAKKPSWEQQCRTLSSAATDSFS